MEQEVICQTNPPAPGPRVTVSIPFHGPPHMLKRAVESILCQTHSHLRVIVLNDGGQPPWRHLADVNDPRLVCFNLPINRGRYFADAVALSATDDPFFLIQDADDWSEPQRIEKLMRQLRAEHSIGAVSAQQHCILNAGSQVCTHKPLGGWRQPLDLSFRHRADHHGLFRTEALRTIGGYYHGFPIGSDTLIVNFLLMIGSLASVEEPLYHRLLRPNSLTKSSATGSRSSFRRQISAKLRQMYAAAFAVYAKYLAGEIEHHALCEHLRSISQWHVTPEESKALNMESQRLREMLTHPMPLPKSALLYQASRTILDDTTIEWPKWAIGRPFAQKLSAYLERQRPRNILETGSGISTILLADYARRHQAAVTSLEHDPQYYDQTKAMLQQKGLQDHVDLRLAPLQPFPCSEGMRFSWYGAAPQGPFDFVFLDGPPERFGRQAAFFAIAPQLAPEWVIWLHDGARTHEQICMKLWSRHFQFVQVFDYTESKGAFYLRSATSISDRLPSQAPPRSTLGIGLLTGDRLPLLRRTIESLLELHDGFVLRSSTVIVLINGDDPETQFYVEQLPFVAACLHHTGSVLPVGTATSVLMDFLEQQQGISHILHLEDDWIPELIAPNWLADAHRILSEHPQVGQVRLRHTREKVLSYHMITRQPIRWQTKEGFLLSPSAHFTFNPSLIRAQDVLDLFPCQTESEAQQLYLASGWASAQLVPGVFVHIGDRHSRRIRLGQRA